MEEDARSHDGHSAPEASSATSEKHFPSDSLGPQDAANTQANKRRRGLGVVTPNACTECRKKRAKCDGQKPCSRCKAQKDVECIYEVPVRQSKENLRHEINQLRKQQNQSDAVFSALLRPDLWEEVLTRLRAGQSVDDVSEWLESPPALASGNTAPSFGQQESVPAAPATSSTHPPVSAAVYGGFLPLPSGYGPAPMGSQVQKQEYDRQSPWAFSSQSQTQSTRSDSHPDIMQWTADGPPRSRVGSWLHDQSSTSESSRYRGLDQVLAPIDSSNMKVPAGTWTSVTGDSALVQHLLALYFCWEYPTFASLSKEHFLKDFLDGRHRYCSPILVNALLALGCRFSTQPSTRANPDDPYTSGDHFFKEALRLLYRETNHHTLTTIQALGIMSIREASCGRDSESWYYAGQSVRMATELGLHRLSDEGDPDELAVQAATFWGAFGLDHAWSLATGSLPQCSVFPHLPPKPAIIDDIEASLWIPYTDDGAPLQRSSEQPSNVRSVYKCFCELSELVHQSLYLLHSPGKPVTSRNLLNIYTQYLNWYDRIPEVLRLGHNFTPAVLFAHMYYHFAILLLFRPLMKLRIIGSSILPRDVCFQAADAIQGLLRSYSQLYTLRRTPSFVPYFVLTTAIVHLAVGAHNQTGESTPTSDSASSAVKAEVSEASHSHSQSSQPNASAEHGASPSRTSAKLNARVKEAINQGIADLTEMAPCHHFAEQALHILRYLAKKWNIEVNIPPPSKALSQADAEQLVRPQTSSLNFFVPNVLEEDFLCAWGSKDLPGGRGESSAGHVAHGSSTQTSTEPGGMPGDVDTGESMGSAKMSTQTKGTDESTEAELGIESIEHTVKSVENPLFWPFPMQGRPMLPSGRMLKEAGFAVL